jgi:DNA-binding SARP family transcriptional activator
MPKADVNLLILGPLEVRVEGVLVPLGGAKPRAMLATLLLHSNQVVSAGRLTDALWADQPPPSAAANIKTYASQLRKALGSGLGSRLETRPPGYLFRVEPGELDLLTFETLAADGRSALARGDVDLAARQLGDALSPWRGEVCADITLGPELDVARSRLDEHRMTVTEDCLQARLHRGEHREVLPQLRGLVTEHPLRERLWEYLMIALSSCGLQADALAAYTACRAAFVRELGLEPSPQLQKLQAAILANDTQGPDKREPPLPAGIFQNGRQDVTAPAAAPEPVLASPDPGTHGPSPQMPLVAAQAAELPHYPVPQYRSPLHRRPWRIWHSLWLLPALLGFGYWTWLSFLYIGIRARRRDWLLIAAAYAALVIGECGLIEYGNPNSNFVAVVFLLSSLAIWAGGVVHGLCVNPSWLRWRSGRTPWYLT